MHAPMETRPHETELFPESAFTNTLDSSEASRGSRSRKSRRNEGATDKLMMQQIMITKKIGQEQARCRDIEARIERAKSEIETKQRLLVQRSKNGLGKDGLQAIIKSKGGSSVEARCRHIEKLKHQLQVQLNTIKTENSKLKKEIDSQRISGCQVNQALDKLIRKNDSVKAAIDRKNDEATRLQAKKDSLAKHLGRLKDQVFSEIASNMQTLDIAQTPMPTLTLKNPTFVNLSPSPRLGSRSARVPRSDRVLVTDRERPQTREAEDPDMQEEVNRAYWMAAKTKMDMQKQVERRQQLAEAFEKIKSETRVSSLAELLETYVAEEELNFEMFGAIGELNQELEELENQKIEYENEMLGLEKKMTERSQSIASADADINKQIQRTQSRKIGYEKEYNLHHKSIMSTEESLKNLITTLCSNDEEDPEAEVLIKNGLTMNNMDKFLAFIEARINVLNQVVPPESDPTRAPPASIDADGGRIISLQYPNAPSTADAVASPSGEGEDGGAPVPLSVSYIKSQFQRSAGGGQSRGADKRLLGRGGRKMSIMGAQGLGRAPAPRSKLNLNPAAHLMMERLSNQR